MLNFLRIDDLPLLPILETTTDGIAIAVANPWRLAYVNPVLATWLGGTQGEYRGRPVDEVFPYRSPHKLSDLINRVNDGSEVRLSVSQEMFATAGGPKRGELRLLRIVLAGEPQVAIVVRGSVGSSERIPEASLGLDPLTGLADRSVLLKRMAGLLRGERAADLQFAVLFIDLDDFKQVNDEFGHLIGDRVLEEVAKRLAGCVRTGDLIVRFGGDEFVALVEHVSGMSEIQPVIDRIDAALARPIELADGEVTLSASVGVAEAALEHQTPEDLLRDADRAMYASKRLPR